MLACRDRRSGGAWSSSSRGVGSVGLQPHARLVHAVERHRATQEGCGIAMPRVMRVAVEHLEMGSRNRLRGRDAEREPNRAIAAPVQDERRRADRRGRLPGVEPVHGAQGGGSGVRRRRGSLMGDVRAPLSGRRAGIEDVRHHARTHTPAAADQLHESLTVLGTRDRRPVEVRAGEHQPTHAFGVARRELDRDRAARRPGHERDLVHSGRIENGGHGVHVRCERVGRLAARARESTARRVHADHPSVAGHLAHEHLERRVLPVPGQMAHPPPADEHGRARAELRPGDIVGARPGVANVGGRGLHEVSMDDDPPRGARRGASDRGPSCRLGAHRSSR